MSDRIKQMVANNAAWINEAVAALGIGGEFTPVLWQNTHDMPPVFPNADALGGTVDEQMTAIKALVKAREGKVVAVKDSWAQLDLTTLGFEELFEAQWLYRKKQPIPAGTGNLQIEIVTTADGLREFALACNGEDIPVEVYSPKLLNRADITWLAGKANGKIVAGVTAVKAEGLNGINNLFGANDMEKQHMLIAALRQYPDVPSCGYEGDDAIAPYIPLGYKTAGKLRVWLRMPQG